MRDRQEGEGWQRVGLRRESKQVMGEGEEDGVGRVREREGGGRKRDREGGRGECVKEKLKRDGEKKRQTYRERKSVLELVE